MIFDRIENSGCYEKLLPGLDKAFAFLRSIDEGLKSGRHEIDGDHVFAMVDRYQTKPIEEALYDAHRKYLDVQCVLSGSELLLWAPLDSMQELVRPYEDAKDVMKWRAVQDYCTELRMTPSAFAILFPQDAHSPGVQWEKQQQVTKVVVKVAVV